MKRNTQGETDYCCPCCYKQLTQVYGNQIFPNDPKHGIMLFCRHGDPDAKTHPQEVAGHGKTAKDAYAVILAKFAGAKYETEMQSEDTTE